MRTYFVILIYLLGISLSSVSWADSCENNGSCCDELNSMWQDKYLDDLRMTDSDQIAVRNTFSCPSAISKFIESLKFLESSSNSHYSSIVSSLKKNDYITMLSPGDSLAEVYHGYMALVVSSNHIIKTNTAIMAGVLVHENQHMVLGQNGEHETCKHGTLSGKQSCDAELSFDLSNAKAFSWEMSYLHDLLENDDVNDLAKKAASFEMKALIKNAFNKIPKKGPDGKTPIHDYYGI